MTDEDWDDSHARSLGLFINGESMADVDSRGQPVVDDSFLLLLSAHHEAISWTLPAQWARPWEVVLCTAEGGLEGSTPDAQLEVPARSVVVLSDAES